MNLVKQPILNYINENFSTMTKTKLNNVLKKILFENVFNEI